MPHRSKVMSDDSDNVALLAGVWAWVLKLYTIKFVIVKKFLTIQTGQKHLRRRPCKNKPKNI
jgi:hypothetical protein